MSCRVQAVNDVKPLLSRRPICRCYIRAIIERGVGRVAQIRSYVEQRRQRYNHRPITHPVAHLLNSSSVSGTELGQKPWLAYILGRRWICGTGWSSRRDLWFRCRLWGRGRRRRRDPSGPSRWRRAGCWFFGLRFVGHRILCAQAATSSPMRPYATRRDNPRQE